MKLYIQLLSVMLVTALVATLGHAQSFDETWKEFLDNDKVSNISALMKPDKRFDQQDYVKYVLMNTNNAFCETDLERAERLVSEIYTVDPTVHKAVPGFVPKFDRLRKRIRAYYGIDSLWQRFLQGKQVTLAELATVEEADRLCEKQTAAKLSYMMAYEHLCADELERAAELFETRTLRLAEKTSLKIEDVKGLAPRVATMKEFFTGLKLLDDAWAKYEATGTSPGFAPVLPVYECNVAPKVKELVLRGLASPCGEGLASLRAVDSLLAKAGDVYSVEFEVGVDELREVAGERSAAQAALDTAWNSFVASGEVDPQLTYGYEYCTTEPLIRAYLLDGYSFVCGLAETNLATIDSLRRARRVALSRDTKQKIKELAGLREEYRRNGTEIERIWTFFVANDDQLLEDYTSTDAYCDHVEEVKDWTMRGLTSDCSEALFYLDEIEKFNEKFDFKFYEDLECRVQRLRVRIYDCRYATLDELAQAEAAASTEDAPVDYGSRLAELLMEYDVGERPAPAECEE